MLKKISIKFVPEINDILIHELQNGFYVVAEEGATLRTFLIRFCNIPEDYLTEKIKTIFHNGNPVDNPGKVKLSDGDDCALSGAMPGLVGAMMRMGSPYAVMRESITEKENVVLFTGKKIYVRLKLFNVILKDLYSAFIFAGVILDRKDLLRIIKKTEESTGGSFRISVDNRETDSSDIEMMQDNKYIISVQFD